jgi:predicted nucleic acid-binding protein
MPPVVSNTSPLNYLILIGCDRVLAELFDSVVIPGAVSQELSSEHAPSPVREWMAARPSWIAVRQVAAVPADLRSLDVGEAEAIALALETSAELVLLDERRGRRAARERRVNVAGTLGVLDAAAARGLIELSETLDALARTSFRMSPRLLRQLRART